MGWPGTRSSWPTGKERGGGQCRRVFNTPHQAGSKHGGLGGVCAHLSRRRANPRAGLSGGCRSRAERAAAHHSRENAGWGFAAAERSSRARVCCCVGQAKVNGATKQGVFYHQGTPVVEKSFNPTWVGAPQFCIYISRRPTVGRHLTCLCMESKAICMESEAIYI